MTIEQKYNAMIAFLMANGPLECEFELAPIDGHIEYTIHKIWAERNYYGLILMYKTLSFPECTILRSDNNFDADVDHLYDQMSPLFDRDKNLF